MSVGLRGVLYHVTTTCVCATQYFCYDCVEIFTCYVAKSFNLHSHYFRTQSIVARDSISIRLRQLRTTNTINMIENVLRPYTKQKSHTKFISVAVAIYFERV